jgi:hypothetical protein
MLRFHILHRCGWIGDSERRSVHRKREPRPPLLPGDIDVHRQTITIHEADWERAGLLMPPDVRQMLRNEQEKSADQELLHREYAPNVAPETCEDMLLPIGVTG